MQTYIKYLKVSDIIPVPSVSEYLVSTLSGDQKKESSLRSKTFARHQMCQYLDVRH